ncbi:MAG: oligosaccharide flippase family protein, partial [Candidatus Omnitrophica bacterium]|nr:oligosaccharide flippase family protein [Candidatus Omnitrophota bacterium]
MLGKISLSKIRNQFNSLLKNSFSIFSVKILTPISSFVIVLSIAMYLGDSGLGKYSIVFTYYGIFRLISFLGLDNLLTREIVKNKTEVNRYLSNFVIIGLISSVLCYVCMLLLVFVMKYPSDIIAAVSILGFSFFAASGMLICESIFIAFEKVKYTAYAYFVREIVKISLVLLLLKAGGAIPSVISAILIADFTALFIQGFLFDKYI